MATIVEATVQVVVKLRLDDDGTAKMIVEARTYDATGELVRAVGGWDVTDSLTAPQKATITNIVTVATDRAKAKLGIA